MTDVSVLLCTTIKRASRWARSDAIWCSLLSWNPPRLVERYPAVQSDQKKKKKKGRSFSVSQGRMTRLSAVGHYRGSWVISEARRRAPAGGRIRRVNTDRPGGLPDAQSPPLLWNVNYLIRLTKAAEGGREEEFAQAAAWDGDEGVCARARLTMPSCLIPDLTSVPSSPLSLFICPPLLFSLSISVVDVVVYTEREYVSGVWKSGTEMMPVNF